jgi:hypothetical protein
MRKLAFLLAMLGMVPNPSLAKDPDCGSPNGWAAPMVFAAMKNAKLITNDEIDFTRTKVMRIASEKIGKDLWRQVYDVRYFRKNGSVVEAIAVSDASREECSMSDVQTFVVSKKL